MEAFLLGHGVQMALPEDCVAAMMRLACDRTINGQLIPFGHPRTVQVVSSKTRLANQGVSTRSLTDHHRRKRMQGRLSGCRVR